MLACTLAPALAGGGGGGSNAPPLSQGAGTPAAAAQVLATVPPPAPAQQTEQLAGSAAALAPPPAAVRASVAGTEHYSSGGSSGGRSPHSGALHVLPRPPTVIPGARPGCPAAALSFVATLPAVKHSESFTPAAQAAYKRAVGRLVPGAPPPSLPPQHAQRGSACAPPCARAPSHRMHARLPACYAACARLPAALTLLLPPAASPAGATVVPTALEAEDGAQAVHTLVVLPGPLPAALAATWRLAASLWPAPVWQGARRERVCTLPGERAEAVLCRRAWRRGALGSRAAS